MEALSVSELNCSCCFKSEEDAEDSESAAGKLLGFAVEKTDTRRDEQYSSHAS